MFRSTCVAILSRRCQTSYTKRNLVKHISGLKNLHPALNPVVERLTVFTLWKQKRRINRNNWHIIQRNLKIHLPRKTSLVFWPTGRIETVAYRTRGKLNLYVWKNKHLLYHAWQHDIEYKVGVGKYTAFSRLKAADDCLKLGLVNPPSIWDRR